ncbi:hypothetical protein D0865_03497 [Hortaea werneckii]|uniref:LysM domain-containing protein n=1 Tax=Hortaea werneckii TaxID=91943 RepID=A0A3M7CXN7_HORWE|nr:hypothetical protein D0865_03497 [Hortaea werneckii]
MHIFAKLFYLSTLASYLADARTTLFNGAQHLVFDDAPAGCLAAFGQPLVCDDEIQLLGYDFDSFELTETFLDALCSKDCARSLLSLKDAVSSACGKYDTPFNGAYISAVEVVDLFAYKYNMSCLANTRGEFCLIVEQQWDVDSLDLNGHATWPAYTEQIYPDFSEGDYDRSPAEDVDGILLDLFDDPIMWSEWNSHLQLDESGEDYFLEPILPDWRGHGHDLPLEYNEYPLEIQCSECFLAQYRHGIESKWGEVYDEVSDQAWNNIRRNRNIDWQLVPANNRSTWLSSFESIHWTHRVSCDRMIEFQEETAMTVDDLAVVNKVASAALLHLNDIRVNHVESGSYCAPLPCEIAIIESRAGAKNFVDSLGNITYTQFWSWNDYMEPKNLRPGETVFVGYVATSSRSKSLLIDGIVLQEAPTDLPRFLEPYIQYDLYQRKQKFITLSGTAQTRPGCF